MIRLMADNMCVGHVDQLWTLCQSSPFLRDMLADLGVSLVRFHDVGLSANADDREVRTVCRDGDILLLTIDRKRGEDNSLQAVLDEEARIDDFRNAVPVVRFSRLRLTKETRVFAYELVELLQDIDVYRGTGRQYLPKNPA